MIDLWEKILSNFTIIAGPCVIESEDLVMEVAEKLKTYTDKWSNTHLIFKSSFDKANRTSISSFRSIGFEKSLQILEKVETKLQIPVITDVHEDTPIDEVASVVSVLQTPAFLCRQTNFILRVASAGLPVNIKKGQFLAPWDMTHVVKKAMSTGNEKIMVCERGTCFGYNTLIADMTSLVHLRETGCPVIFDATHSAQKPGGQGSSSGGSRYMAEQLAKAATAVGVNGLFLETHPTPDKALSDGPNSIELNRVPKLLQSLIFIDLFKNG